MNHRVGVSIMFFVHGAVFANWAARIPQVRQGLGLSEAALGFTLLGLSVGVLTALPLAGWFIGRFSSRRVTVAAGVLQALLLMGLAAAPSPFSLAAALFAFGAAASIMDIAMNAQAVEVERQHTHPIMSAFHGAYSIGGFVGAGMGAAFAALDVAPLPHFVVIALLFALVLIAFAPTLTDVAGEATSGPVFALPPAAVLPLGVVAFCSTLGEGTMADWSAVYITDVVGAGDATAALGFSAFNLMMTVGRLTGDRIAERLRRDVMVRVGGGLAAAGLLLAIMVPVVPVVIGGFALVGLGLATVIPLTFSAAGRTPDVSPGRGIAGVATIGYAGFLAGPPIIGVIAQGIGLQASMGLVAAAVGLLVIMGGAVKQP